MKTIIAVVAIMIGIFIFIPLNIMNLLVIISFIVFAIGILSAMVTTLIFAILLVAKPKWRRSKTYLQLAVIYIDSIIVLTGSIAIVGAAGAKIVSGL